MNHSDTLSSPGGLVPEPALPAPGSFFAWIAAARLKTLPAGAAPVMVGTAVAAAEGHFSALPALAALLGALWIQVGTNFANDLFDYLKGADTEERAGPVRVTQAGLLSQRQVTAGVIVSFAIASLCGVYLISVAGWPIVAIGIASILSGIAYTGG
ncbi:MAG: UbiA family prenyltransferase, partial [Chrysiogenetes bacterium]|nr:UbiA family prenyltransferase [Chrysiogenetes bacterium]